MNITELINSNNTETVLDAMLKENVGRAMCDSGGTPQYDEDGKYIGSSSGYGRNFERNAGVDFKENDAIKLSFKYGIEILIDVFQWLKERLTFNDEMSRLFYNFANLEENVDSHWLELMEAFPQHAVDIYNADVDGDYRATGIYGDGKPMSINTYNGECALSQTLQYVYFEIDGTNYVALQTHNGADVRGGYSTPFIFTVNDETALFNVADATIYCEDGDHVWDTSDAGYSWTYNGSEQEDIDVQELQEYQIVNMADEDLNINDIDKLLDGETLFVDADGIGHCPICGLKLGASA